MRFLQDSPSIPDELLTARDEGRVIFFCGAGVSRAFAKLPDFFELAQKVIDSLGVLEGSPARQLIAKAHEMEKIPGVGNLIPADRVFGLLEREFQTKDIETAVAEALRPKPDVDLSAHRTLIKLGRGPDQKVRLVTTNFDLLFEACDGRLVSWKPPSLPDPQRYEDFAGIIHLHGHVSDSYYGAAGEGFVLSSAEFGRAYLSEAWGTQFIRLVMDRYLVVFVGYRADDPPVQYLLEALNRSSAASSKNIYAFQSGSESEAQALWQQKGVNPIVYGERQVLWKTLDAWAERARNPDAWTQRLIRNARAGPHVLLPHERGQVVHLVSTPDGAKKFASTKKLPPASWLYAFDPATRYAQPSKLNMWQSDDLFYDPFADYGLDSDTVPPKITRENRYEKRKIPSDSFDVFAPTERDRENIRDTGFAGFRGRAATSVPELTSRLGQLGIWLAKVSDQPAAVWWAAGQDGLHPWIREQITSQLRRSRTVPGVLARRAWRYIFESWHSQLREHLDAYELKQTIDQDGWTASAIREYAWLHRPYINVSRPYEVGPKSAASRQRVRLGSIVNIGVEHPHHDIEIPIPDEPLKKIIIALRLNLELAIDLETELGSFRLGHMCSIEADPDLAGESSERSFGVARSVLFYVGLFRRLLNFDVEIARDECSKWSKDDHIIFAALRVWICGFHELISDIEASAILSALPQDVFWNSYRQRDLLLVLAKRWAGLTVTSRKMLERRLMAGPPRRRGLENAKYLEYRAWVVLQRLYWLHDQGCAFTFDLETKTSTHRATLPGWKPEDAKTAAKSQEGHGGYVRMDSSYAELLNVPLANLFAKAFESRHSDHDRLITRDPFEGLVKERPVRALAALRYAGTKNRNAPWGWQSFLLSQARGSDQPRLQMLIARRLLEMTPAFLNKLSGAPMSWLKQARKVLCTKDRMLFLALFDKLVVALKAKSNRGRSSRIVRKVNNRDWTVEAINSPAGNLAEALLGDSIIIGLKSDASLPAEWVKRARKLTKLPGDGGRYASLLFASQLNWFYAIDRAWTEANLLTPISTKGALRDAILAGFFWQPQISGYSLYARLKPTLLKLAILPKHIRDRQTQALASLLLAGWNLTDEQTGGRWTTSQELKATLLNGDDDFRMQSLWLIGRWPKIEDKVALLSEVWPKQMAARSSKVTFRLFDLAFNDDKNFPILVDAILPLVSTFEGSTHYLPMVNHARGDLLDRYPEKVLTLLYAVLGQDAKTWPYGSEAALQRIGTADESLLKDRRLIELWQRWNRR